MDSRNEYPHPGGIGEGVPHLYLSLPSFNLLFPNELALGFPSIARYFQGDRIHLLNHRLKPVYLCKRLYATSDINTSRDLEIGQGQLLHAIYTCFYG